MEIKTVSLIGLGALGVLFGQQISKCIGGNLKIIADGERVKRYRNEGVYCNGARCAFDYVTPEEKCPPADLILIAVKFNGLSDAVAAIANHVGTETIILSLLNGISSEEIISRVYGRDRVLPCVAYGMDAVKTGSSLTYQNAGNLSFGDFEPGVVSEKVKTVGRFFTKAGIAHEISEDTRKKQWSKFMLNAGINQVTAVYLCDYAGVQREGLVRDLMIAAMREVAALAEKEHILLTQQDIDYWLKIMDSLNPLGKTSMQQDAEARRFSEVEMLGGTVLALGEKHGLPTPVNRLLYDKLKATESTY